MGKTPREAMQSLGTEWGRELIHPDIWVTAWSNYVFKIGAGYVVVDDVRFLNEINAVRNRNGIIVRVERPGQDETLFKDHVSEKEWRDAEYDHKLVNTGERESLRASLAQLLIEIDAKSFVPAE